MTARSAERSLRLLLPLALLLGSVGCIAPKPKPVVAPPPPGWTFDAGSDEYLDGMTGLRLPAQIGPHRRAQVRALDLGGTRFSCDYVAHTPVEVTVYPVQPPTVGELPIDLEYARVALAVRSRHPDTMLIVRGAIAIDTGVRYVRGKRALYEFTENGQVRSGVIDLFQVGRKYVRFESTFPDVTRHASLAELGSFLAAFPWPAT